MNNCGERIASHRKRLNLTQTELGEQLNVTAQAISKWETGASEPDLSTVRKLCKIFGITVDELLGGEEAEPAEAPAQAGPEPQAEPQAEPSAEAQAAPETAAQADIPAILPIAPAEAVQAPVQAPAPVVQAPAPVHAEAPKVIAGYCESCKRPLYQGEDYHIEHRGRSSTPYLYCPECTQKRDKAHRLHEYSHEKKLFLGGMICGGCVGGVLLLAFLITALVTGDSLYYLGLVLAVPGFTFASTVFWSETVQDMFLFFLKSFRMPGLIFTLSLDGIIWLITVKLGLAILSALLSVFCFLFGCIFTPLASIFIFPFSLSAECVKVGKLKHGAKK